MRRRVNRLLGKCIKGSAVIGEKIGKLQERSLGALAGFCYLPISVLMLITSTGIAIARLWELKQNNVLETSVDPVGWDVDRVWKCW